MPMHKNWWLAIGLACVAAATPPAGAVEDDEFETRKWEETAVQLPAAPRPEDLIPFYVSATSDNRFLVDSRSLNVGNDGVVRFTLLVETPAGVRNVSFEGMRCETRERRLYAFGQSDGSWSPSRNHKWERIHETGRNRQHAALFQEYFCPGGIIVATAEVALRALRKGGHASVTGY